MTNPHTALAALAAEIEAEAEDSATAPRDARKMRKWAATIRSILAQSEGGEAVYQWRLRTADGWTDWAEISHDNFLRLELQSPEIDTRILFAHPAKAGGDVVSVKALPKRYPLGADGPAFYLAADVANLVEAKESQA